MRIVKLTAEPKAVADEVNDEGVQLQNKSFTDNRCKHPAKADGVQTQPYMFDSFFPMCAKVCG